MIVSHDKPRLPQDFTEQADGPQSALQLTALSTQKLITTFNQKWLRTTCLDNSQSAFPVMPSAIFDQVGNLAARKQNVYSYHLAYGCRAGNLNWPIRIQLAGKNLVSSRQCNWQELAYGIEIRQRFSLEMAWNIHERGFTIPKTISHCKKWKIWNILCLQLLIWLQKW